MRNFCTWSAVFSLAVSVSGASASTSLPVVDLGYERHQAISFNSTGGFYNFSNIRYAQPPVGALRFAAPVAVTGSSSVVNNGSVGVTCPQALPAWYIIAGEFVPAYLTGQPFNLSAAVAALANGTGSVPAQDPRTTEDCLFLDVYVPQKVFRQAGHGCGAPVMVWIYGGGYTEGEKNGDGVYNPAGLIKASQVSGNDGMIFVSINYRLGAFGWLAGPTLQSNGTANAGLYDQRLALQWVQKNIHLFGGNPAQVTVAGESAGGGSIFHQITAFGGLLGPAPFAQAIPQSPAWQITTSHYQMETTFNTFLALLNVGTIEEARQLPSAQLILANLIQVGLNSTYGSFSFGPVVDGLFAPDVPGKLLLQGSYDKKVNVMVGHNADEALIFTSPAIQNDTALSAFVQFYFPDISPAVLSYVENVLYPPIFNGSYGYTSDFQRAVVLSADISFICNTNYLDRAFDNKTYAYQFSVGAALHGQDIPYTFFNGPSPSVVNDTIAVALQEYITSFVNNGVPSGPGIPKFPMYGTGAMDISLSATSISDIFDPTANARCSFWQKALYT